MGFHDFDVMLTKQFISRLTFQKRNRSTSDRVRRAASIHAEANVEARAKFLKMRTVVLRAGGGRAAHQLSTFLAMHTARQALLSSLSENALILSAASLPAVPGIIK